jgi:hypothetical protein
MQNFHFTDSGLTGLAQLVTRSQAGKLDKRNLIPGGDRDISFYHYVQITTQWVPGALSMG